VFRSPGRALRPFLDVLLGHLLPFSGFSPVFGHGFYDQYHPSHRSSELFFVYRFFSGLTCDFSTFSRPLVTVQLLSGHRSPIVVTVWASSLLPL
jgi:hypothetical protein